MRLIDLIVIHCADTPDDSSHRYTVEDIDDWHRNRKPVPFHRQEAARAHFNPSLTSIGYHYVVYRDGTLHTGRGESEIGAHVEGHNAHSLGICLIGRSRFTPRQWETLRLLVGHLQKAHPGCGVAGHYRFNRGKTCPNFNVPAWLQAGLTPPEGAVYLAAKVGAALSCAV